MSESRLYKTEIFSAIVLGASTRKCIQNRIKTNNINIIKSIILFECTLDRSCIEKQ